MKFILAPDKFKGSLTGIEFCNAVEEGIKSVLPEAQILKLPLADGGDGTIDIIDYHLNGELIQVEVHDPLFTKIQTDYLFIDHSKTAFIEMAKASGMDLLTPEEQNCFYTTSLGTGELILDAIQKGAKNIILGIGGSATNDCGIGMATALGYQFLDQNKNIVKPIGKNLSRIHSIDNSKLNPGLANITFQVACDVTNPLYGINGAAVIYGPQKGANKNEVRLLDKGLRQFSKVILDKFKLDVQNIPGSGAAGGMGAGTLTFLNAELLSGIDLIKDLVAFDNKIANADWIITGEGKLDSQTFSGKTIKGVIDSAKRCGISVAVFCGIIQLSKKDLNNLGISYGNSILNKAKSFDDAMKGSHNYLKSIAVEFSESIKF